MSAALETLKSDLAGRLGGLEPAQQRQVVKQGFDDFDWQGFKAALAAEILASGQEPQE